MPKATITDVMDENPKIRALFEAVRSYVETLGPVETIPHKTQYSFGGKEFATNFAFVWLPQMIQRNFPENALVLTFDLPREVKHPRIREATKLRPDRWVHHVVITKKADLDKDVKAWLRESCAFGKIGLRAWRKLHGA